MRGVRWLAAGALGLAAGLAAGAPPSPTSPVTPPAPAKTAPKAETPLVFYTGDGKFEIIAMQAGAAQEALVLAGGVWRALAKPLSLPRDGFSSAVAVRLVPAAEWKGPAAFSVVSEPGGLVSARVRWTDRMDARIARRALVQAVLLRQAVFWHGASKGVTVPLWLELACTALCEVGDRPSMLDAMQQQSVGLVPPPLEALLRHERGPAESEDWQLASFWLFQYLRDEAADPRRWAGWLRALLGGTDPMRALQGTYGLAWKDPASRELWWRVGFYNESRAPSLPLLSAAETRNWLADRCRWLAVRHGRERVLPLGDLWTERRTPWVKAELTQRSQQIQNLLPRLHPFYLNGAISVGRLYQAAVKGNEGAFKAALQALMRDAADGRELETATKTALDALEAGHGARNRAGANH